jgi:hypothetical protein
MESTMSEKHGPPSETETALYTWGTILLLPIGVTFPAFVYMKFWAWHVVPVWHLAPLSYGHALGFSTLFALLRLTSTPTPKEEPRRVFVSVVAYIISMALGLFIGWSAS